MAIFESSSLGISPYKRRPKLLRAIAACIDLLSSRSAGGMPRALVCVRLGDPALPVGSPGAPLELRDVLSQALEAHSVRIKVTAASLNYADALVLQGQYQEKPALPFTPGGEVSGTVVELGSAVRGLTVGDAVLAVLPRFGGFATEVVASARDCFVVSPRLNLVAASGLAVAYGTAEVALSHRCRVAHGHTVLVLGAAGGVGLAAVQVAKALGARVIAVARGTAKCAALRSRESPHLVIDSETLYKERTLKQAIAAVAPKGVHCIFDPVGGSMLTEAMKCAAWGCQIALIGFASGEIPKLSANVLLVKNLTAHGVYWGSYAQHQPDVLRDSLARLAGWMEDGIVNVRVSHALPMEKAHEAFRALLRREAIGKVVLVPGERAKL